MFKYSEALSSLQTTQVTLATHLSLFHILQKLNLTQLYSPGAGKSRNGDSSFVRCQLPICHARLAICEKNDSERICQSTVGRKRMSNSQNGSHYEHDHFFHQNLTALFFVCCTHYIMAESATQILLEPMLLQSHLQDITGNGISS